MIPTNLRQATTANIWWKLGVDLSAIPGQARDDGGGELSGGQWVLNCVVTPAMRRSRVREAVNVSWMELLRIFAIPGQARDDR